MTETITDVVRDITRQLDKAGQINGVDYDLTPFHNNVLLGFPEKPGEPVRKIIKDHDFYWEGRSLLWINPMGKRPTFYKQRKTRPKPARTQVESITKPSAAPNDTTPKSGLPSLEEAFAELEI